MQHTFYPSSTLLFMVLFEILGSDSTYDFKSRYFAPWVGIPEDPVTGSAHTVLAPYWSQILQKVYNV